MKNIKLISILILTISILGCQPGIISLNNVEKYDYTIAEANNGFRLTMPDLYDHIFKSPTLLKGGILDTALVKKFLDSMIVDSLIGFEADNIDLDTNKTKSRMFKKRYYRDIINDYYNVAVRSKVTVDSVDVVEFYNYRTDMFSVPERVELYHILIAKKDLLYGIDSARYNKLSKDEFEQKGGEYVQSIREMIDSKESFMEIAKKYSHDALSNTAGGYVGWTPRNKYYHPFDSIAFQMEVGQISDPYMDVDGWHIIYINDYMPEGIPPLNEDIYQIAKTAYLKQEESIVGNALLDSLFNEIKLEYNEPLMNQDWLNVDEDEWIAVVNGQDTIEIIEAKSYEMGVRSKDVPNGTTYEKKESILFEAAKSYKVVQAAKEIGIDKSPEIVEKAKNLRHRYARSMIEKDRYDPTWRPTDSLINDYYQKHIDDYKNDKPLFVQHIIAEDSLLAEFIRDQALSGVDFLELAKEYYPGEESIRLELADLGQIGPKDVPEAFYDKAMITPAGMVSDPVKTEFGYHIIKVLNKIENLSVDEARSDIMAVLREQHTNETYENYKNNLFAKYNIVFKGKLYPVQLKPFQSRK